MNKFTFPIAAIVAMIFSVPAYSAQFSSVVDSVAIPKNASYSGHSWEDADKIRGITWRWPYYNSGAHNYTMIGETKVGNSKNPNIGYTEVRINGNRNFIVKAHILMQNGGVIPSKESVNYYLGKGKVIKIKSSCDEDYMSYISSHDATYRFTKKNFKPVFVRYSSSWGASGSGSTGIVVANYLEQLNEYDSYRGFRENCYDKQTLDKWK